jgi:hypothetical protein
MSHNPPRPITGIALALLLIEEEESINEVKSEYKKMVFRILPSK